MKKQVSPVVTVIVILVVVVIVALLWNHFGNPRTEAGAGRGGFGINMNVDLSKVKPEDLEAARKKAAEARDKLMGEARAAKGKAAEKAGD